MHIVLRVHAHNAASALVQIAQNVAEILFGNGNSQFGNRLQEDGGRVFQPFLKRNFRRRLKRRFRRVDVVITSVVQYRFYANDGVSRKYAVRQALDNPLFDRRNILFGNGAADDLFCKFKIALARFKTHFTMPVLSVSARLLFVFSFRRGRFADRFFVCNLRRAEIGIRTKFGFEFFANDVEVNFTLSADKRFERIGILFYRETLILFRKTGKSRKHFVFRTLHFGVYRHVKNGLGEYDFVEFYGRVFITKGVARSRICKFRNGTDIACDKFADRLLLFPFDKINGVNTLLRARICVEHRHARAQNATANADVVEFSDKRVNRRLKYLRRKRFVFFASNGNKFILQKVDCGKRLALCRLRDVFDDFVHEVFYPAV